MLRVKELEATLRRAMTDGVTNVMLVNDEGALIAAARSEEVDQTVSAVLASIYNEYKVAERFVDRDTPTSLQSILFDCASARVACTTLDGQVLVCVCGDRKTQYGILWNKLELLKEGLKCLEPVFAPMASVSSG
uniref:Roadblock/LAMTOR2 domain-containing protein n=1 Tax=Noctiluca scintillans TaxID=2966 RepID=A0A7S1ATL7_NOCSC|mmetsp:Transcript_59216/g.157629  ORF Transcript_59216/g.157629 Transcript_59216/m.157629 type:complete len:134 (+) Transcript_59216:63-464(+)